MWMHDLIYSLVPGHFASGNIAIVASHSDKDRIAVTTLIVVLMIVCT